MQTSRKACLAAPSPGNGVDWASELRLARARDQDGMVPIMEEAGALLAWICQTAGTRRDVIIAGIALLPEAARLQGQTLHTESFEPQLAVGNLKKTLKREQVRARDHMRRSLVNRGNKSWTGPSHRVEWTGNLVI
ncbi:hypothetical protein V2G26_002541 [Clonostachys chloroleuca]